MNNKRLLTTGIIGSVIAAICCFTPLLIILLSAIGLGGLVSYLDYGLLPALAIFLCIVVYALWRQSKTG